MASATRDQAVADARSVGSAAAALARALQNAPDAVIDAADHLQLQGTLAVESSVEGFDSAEGDPSDEDRLAASISSLSIGLTLVAAEVSSSGGDPDHLIRAVDLLERNADELEATGVRVPQADLFDTQPGGVALTRRAAALAALDEMAASAADVATSTLDKAFKPLVNNLPDAVADAVDQLDLDLGGRLVSLGMRAVRHGLNMLLTLVDMDAIARARVRIDSLLSQLGKGKDAAVLTGWAIGADEVREVIATAGERAETTDGANLVQELAQLAERYAAVCASLRRIAVVLVGLGGLLALVQVTLPHSLAVTTIGLALVLGAAVVLGRDYTGVTDLPGPVRGVRLILDGPDGNA